MAIRLTCVRFTVRGLMSAAAVAALLAAALAEARRRSGPVAALVGRPAFDFGTMPRRAMGTHRWIIRNRGRAPLVLSRGSSYPDCVVEPLKGRDTEIVPPGRLTTVTVRWETRGYRRFAQAATLLTNDPEAPAIEIRVKGVTDSALGSRGRGAVP